MKKKFAVLLMALTSLFFCSSVKSQYAEKPRAIRLNLGGGVMLDFVLIPPGRFLMGSKEGEDNEKPVHEVTISQPFYLGMYEVTQAQWNAVMGIMFEKECQFKGPNLPVTNVSWDDCQKFIKKLNSRGLGTFRLPTEAEWEYACRAGTTGEYAGDLDKMAWYRKNSGLKTHPVGTKTANRWGLYDMHGNVSEWCQDRYGKYKREMQIDPKGASASKAGKAGDQRVNRGGGCVLPAFHSHSAWRAWSSPRLSHNGLGFRLVRMVP